LLVSPERHGAGHLGQHALSFRAAGFEQLGHTRGRPPVMSRVLTFSGIRAGHSPGPLRNVTHLDRQGRSEPVVQWSVPGIFTSFRAHPVSGAEPPWSRRRLGSITTRSTDG
jgi:hypothetical protein